MLLTAPLKLNLATKIRTNLLVFSSTREERYNVAAKNTTSVVGNVLPYTSAITKR